MKWIILASTLFGFAAAPALAGLSVSTGIAALPAPRGVASPMRSDAAWPTTAPARWAPILSELRVRFYDPVSASFFTAAGPFQVLATEHDRVVLRGAAIDGHASPRLTLRRVDTSLWLFARFETREFALQIR